MTITIASNPRVGTDTHSGSGNIPKSNEQRVQEKEHNLARKRKLKATIDAAIEQINNIIEGLATETGIGFTKACNYVHLGGHIFKGHQHPTIQNTYRFCSMRVEDGRCKSTYVFFCSVWLNTPTLRK